METYFTFIYDSEDLDLEETNKVDVQEYADEWWELEITDSYDDLVNGETFEDIGYIVEFYILPNGDRREVGREEYTLFYEHYHGDLAEHGVKYSGYSCTS